MATVPSSGNKCALFLVSLWGATGGTTLAQAINPKVSWYIHGTLPLPFCSLLIAKSFNKECSCPSSIKAKNCAQAIFSIEGAVSVISFVAGATLSLLSNYLFGNRQPLPLTEKNTSGTQDLYPEQVQIVLFIAQVAFLSIHFLSKYAYNKVSNETADEEIEVVSQKEETLPHDKKIFMEEAEEIEAENAHSEKGFKELKNFIDTDPILLGTFKACYEETKDILLPPYEEDDSPPLPDPIVEKWSRAAYRQLYYEGLLVRFKDFLTKNPKFAAVFKERLAERKVCLELMNANR